MAFALNGLRGRGGSSLHLAAPGSSTVICPQPPARIGAARHPGGLDPCDTTAQIRSRIDGTIGRASAINSMWRILCFTRTRSLRAKEFSMVAALVVLLGLMYAVRIVLLMIGETPGDRKSVV